MSTKIHEIRTVRAGQVRPYADSVYDYELTADPTLNADSIWEEVQSGAHPKLRRAQHRADNQRHDGSCGFPFGLDTFGSIRAIEMGKWRYTVTEPYCD